jgi:hypothetical protein
MANDPDHAALVLRRSRADNVRKARNLSGDFDDLNTVIDRCAIRRSWTSLEISTF